jgi:hypothetical protein
MNLLHMPSNLVYVVCVLCCSVGPQTGTCTTGEHATRPLPSLTFGEAAVDHTSYMINVLIMFDHE